MALPDGGSTTESLADVQVSLTASPSGPVVPGATLEYTASFSNYGPDTATGVALAITVPAQLTDVVASTSAGVTQREGSYVWDVLDLDPGAGGWVTVRGTVDPAVLPPSNLTSTAQIAAAEVDLDLANNSASVSTEMVAPPATMHVADMNGLKSSEVRKGWYASVTALILDHTNAPVANATVAFTWSAGVAGTSSCVTAADGVCTSISPKVATTVPSVAVQVANVTHATASYVADENLISSTVVYREAPINQPPVAVFTYGCTDLACDFDGTGSYDPEGSSLSLSWDFGDGQTATEAATVAHGYAVAGTYTVVLTVTDSQGASHSDTQTVVLGSAPETGTTVRVAAIALTAGRAGPSRFATAIVTIRDNLGNPVGGATVSAKWAADYNANVQGITSADGTVTFTSGKVKKANATFSVAVIDVAAVGLSYVPTQNVVTSATIIVP